MRQSRFLSSTEEGPVKSLTKKHYNIPITTLQGHSRPTDCVWYFNRDFTACLNVFFLPLWHHVICNAPILTYPMSALADNVLVSLSFYTSISYSCDIAII